MNTAVDCLTYEHLESLLNDAGDDRARRHIATCPACRRRLDVLRKNNDVWGLVQAYGAHTDDDKPPGPSKVASIVPALIRGYELHEEIHRGGQGIVYRAYHAATKRTVAIKLLLHGAFATTHQRVRFEREVELVAALHHPNIAAVYDSGVTQDGRPFLVMQHIDGLPLTDYWRQAFDEDASDTKTLERKLRIFQTICEAVNFAHQHGVIHRDLKPSNILVDRQESPHVLDFGLAKSTYAPSEGSGAPAVSIAGEFMGTLGYASPEQTTGLPDEIDIRSDVYSLGVILYELLTDSFPYPVTAPLAQVVDNIRSTDPVAPSTRREPRPRWPRADEIDAIVLRALAKDKNRRYQSAGLLARDLHHFLTGAPVDARSDSSWYVLQKFARRYRIHATVAAAFVALIIGFGITMALMYNRTRAEAAKARQINIFLEDTLASVEPSRGGPDVAVRDVLDDAAQWIEIALAGQPEVAASIHTTIGNAYRSLGHWTLAETHLQKAMHIRSRLFGAESLPVAESMNALANLRRRTGNLDEAEQLYQQALAIRRRRHGEEHTDVALSLQNLGYAHYDAARYDDARACFREALQIRQSILGFGHPDIAMVLVNLARVAAAERESDKARQLYEQALTIFRRALPEQHPDIPRLLMEIAKFELDMGRATSAAPMFREALAIREQALPADHWKIADTRCGLGSCLTELGRFKDAEAHLLAGYRILASQRGAQDERTIEGLRSIFRLYDLWGRPMDQQEYRGKLPPHADIGGS